MHAFVWLWVQQDPSKGAGSYHCCIHVIPSSHKPTTAALSAPASSQMGTIKGLNQALADYHFVQLKLVILINVLAEIAVCIILPS